MSYLCISEEFTYFAVVVTWLVVENLFKKRAAESCDDHMQLKKLSFTPSTLITTSGTEGIAISTFPSLNSRALIVHINLYLYFQSSHTMPPITPTKQAKYMRCQESASNTQFQFIFSLVSNNRNYASQKCCKSLAHASELLLLWLFIQYPPLHNIVF